MVTDAAPSSRAALSGVAWAGLTQMVSKGAAVVTMLVLARLLVPADFGLFAVGLLVINYLDRVKDVGVGAALVYRREEWSRMAATGLPLSVATSVVLAAVAYLGAPLAAEFFREPRATELVRALAVALLISGLSVVPASRLYRQLNFRRRLVPEAAVAVVKGAVAVLCALAGLGVWSLVWGQLAGVVVQCALYWALCGWRPHLAWSRSDARVLLRYGIPSACVALFAVVHENLDYLVIGYRMSGESLGYYTMAYRIPELTVVGICLVVGQVLFPLFSRLQDDLERLAEAYVKAVRAAALVTLPAGLLLTLFAEDLVPVLLSPTWAPAVPVLQLLGLFSAVYAMSFHAGEVYKAIGRPGILNTLAVVKLLVLVPALWVAAGWSITAVAGALLLSNVVLTGVKLVVVSRLLRLPLARLLAAYRSAALATAVMVAVVLAVDWAVLDQVTMSRVAQLLVLLGAAAASFGAAVRVVAPDVWESVAARSRVLGGVLARRRA